MGDDSLAEDDKPSVKDEGCCCSLDLTDDEMVDSDVKRCDFAVSRELWWLSSDAGNFVPILVDGGLMVVDLAGSWNERTMGEGARAFRRRPDKPQTLIGH